MPVCFVIVQCSRLNASTMFNTPNITRNNTAKKGATIPAMQIHPRHPNRQKKNYFFTPQNAPQSGKIGI